MAIACSGCVLERGFPPEHQIVNFDKVDSSLYRGAQPTVTSMEYLKTIGVKSIVCLRMPNDLLAAEPLAAQRLGLAFTNLPMSGVTAPPPGHLDQILDTIERLPKPVFVHCQYGCDRTGTVVACWRIRHGWANEDALREAKSYGMSKLMLPLQEVIRHYRIPENRL